MSLAEFESKRISLRSKDGKPLVHREGDRYRIPFFAGVLGVISDPDVLLDKVISNAEMTGTIASHDIKVRKIQRPKKGSSERYLVHIFHNIRDLATPEDKRQKVRPMLEFGSA